MQGIGKRFGNVVANEEINFAARFGEVHALIGENGAGKSTLMSILAGLYRPDSGQIKIAGETVQFGSPGEAIAHGIGMVYQHFMLVEPFTVVENMVLGERSGTILELEQVEQRITALAAQYDLDVDPRAYIWQLSVGEEQRVEVLRLLYRGARILVFDEPTSVLTPREAETMIGTLRGLAAAGFCVIFISHKLDEVLAVADRVTVLRRGRSLGTFDASTADRASLARMMVGRELAGFVEHPAEEPHDAVPTGELVLEVRQLSALGDKGILAVDGISLGIRASEILGIAGVSGNGQRELAEAITGLRPAINGQVLVWGQDLTKAGPGLIAKAGVAHVPEDRLHDGLIGAMSLSDNAILRQYQEPALSRGPMIIRKAVQAFTSRIVSEYEIQPARQSSPVQTLSGGNQQKLLIGRELSGNPVVLIAVHPTRGIDIGATEAIHEIIRAQRRRGAAILLISEDLDELLALADRIAVLYRGQLLGETPADRAFRDQIGLWMAGVNADA